MTSCNPREQTIEAGDSGKAVVEATGQFAGLLECVRAELAAWSVPDPEPDPVLLDYLELAKWGLVDLETLPVAPDRSGDSIRAMLDGGQVAPGREWSMGAER